MQDRVHLLITEYAAINEDVLDSVAEVTNMIIGNVKTALEDRLGAMGLSTPTVIYGRNFQTRSARQSGVDGGAFPARGRQDVRPDVSRAQSGRGEKAATAGIPDSRTCCRLV